MQRVLARRLQGLVPESKTGLERLIDKKRQSYDLQVELDQKKDQHNTKMKQFRAKAEELERRNLENQQSVVANDQYVRDNWNKRQREEERLLSEEKLLQTKQAELDELNEELKNLTEQEAAIKAQLEETLPYKAYLDAVYEAAPDIAGGGSLNEVQGIVQKYRTMKTWRGTLQVRLMRSKEELRRLRDAIALYDESSTSSTVEIDFQIKKIAQAQEDAFKAFGRQRHEQESHATQSRARAEEAAVIRLTIENMFNKATAVTATRLKKRTEVKATTLLEKFRFVANLITDMIEIEEATRAYNQQQTRSDSSTPGQLKRTHPKTT